MDTASADSGPTCCGSGAGCVFAKALLARAAHCELACRRAAAEAEWLDCSTPEARIACAELAALLHERARFALRLPPSQRPVRHVQALRLQCGGLVALRDWLQAGDAGVHAMVRRAREVQGSLAELPWQQLVPALAAWEPRRRRR